MQLLKSTVVMTVVVRIQYDDNDVNEIQRRKNSKSTSAESSHHPTHLLTCVYSGGAVSCYLYGRVTLCKIIRIVRLVLFPIVVARCWLVHHQPSYICLYHRQQQNHPCVAMSVNATGVVELLVDDEDDGCCDYGMDWLVVVQ